MNPIYVVAVSVLVGALAGWGVRRASLAFARLEELEPGNARWQVYGPPIVTAALFGLFNHQSPNVMAAAEADLFVLVLVQLTFFDLEHGLILDLVILPAIAVALIVSLFRQPWWAGIATGAVVGLAFLAFGVVGSLLLKADALGFGDVKLAVFLGLFLGPVACAEAILMAFAIGGAFAVGLAIVRRSLSGRIAFGPFLSAGALIALHYRS